MRTPGGCGQVFGSQDLPGTKLAAQKKEKKNRSSHVHLQRIHIYIYIWSAESSSLSCNIWVWHALHSTQVVICLPF